MRKRVAIIGISHESNTFLKKKTTLEDFMKGHLLYGEAIRQEYSQAFHELGGMLEIMDHLNIEAVPILFAEATPGGIVTADTLQYLYDKMAAELHGKGPFDGILVAPHGAAVSETYTDMDGWWLQQIRSLIGHKKPIIGTLDPHANVSQSMIDSTNALVAYQTNPHIDQREAGKKAAQLMVDTLAGKIRPVQYFFQPEATISIEQQYTKASPCKELFQFAEEIKNKAKCLSISVLLGFPYADVKEMGAGFIVVTDKDLEKARSSAKELGDYLWKKRAEFVGKKISVQEAVSSIECLDKPVLLLDMGDNVGGGSPGDSTFILKELDKTGKWRSFVCLYDPESVIRARTYDSGSKVRLEIGGKTDHLHGKPYSIEVTVEKITEGVFKENQPRHGGQVNFNMGTIAIVETGNSTTILLTSKRIAPFSLNQLTTFGINPEKYDVIVAKGVHAPMAAYEPACKSFIRVNTEGITMADMTCLTFNYRRKPLYPFENEENQSSR